ncbi:MAG TPA: hypothetical protein VEX38_04675 [Fimbriimonadaceae bacterium]|nr:hypothetical protein [Fimbriimonadaceae bacterium]
MEENREERATPVREGEFDRTGKDDPNGRGDNDFECAPNARTVDVDTFESSLNQGADQNREHTGGGGLRDNELQGDRVYGNANELGVPGAFGNDEHELTEAENNELLADVSTNSTSKSVQRD